MNLPFSPSLIPIKTCSSSATRPSEHGPAATSTSPSTPANPTPSSTTAISGATKLSKSSSPPGTPPSQTAPTLIPSCTPEVKGNPFNDLKEKIAREKLSFDEIVEAARSIKTKSEESDDILENHEDYEHYEYNCEFEDYSDGEEPF